MNSSNRSAKLGWGTPKSSEWYWINYSLWGFCPISMSIGQLCSSFPRRKRRISNLRRKHWIMSVERSFTSISRWYRMTYCRITFSLYSIFSLPLSWGWIRSEIQPKRGRRRKMSLMTSWTGPTSKYARPKPSTTWSTYLRASSNPLSFHNTCSRSSR